MTFSNFAGAIVTVEEVQPVMLTIGDANGHEVLCLKQS